MQKPVDETIARLRSAQRGWAATAIGARLAVIVTLRRLIAERAGALVDELAPALGKRRGEFAASELMPLADACRFLEREAGRLLAPRRLGRRGRPFWLMGTNTVIRREPYGVVLVIGPSNYPLLLPGVQALQALAAGNAVLVKPGRGGAPAMERLAALIAEAGLPDDLLAVTSDSVEDGRSALVAAVDKVVLTGSAETGRAVLRTLAERAVPSVMELSGNDPVLVLPGADLDMAARAVAYGLRLNGSATCIAPRRVIVVGEGCGALRERLLACLSAIPATRVPQPVIDGLSRLVGEVRAGGAAVHGALPGPDGMMAPLLLEGVSPQHSIARADIFAPVAMLMQARDTEEALAVAHASPYALGASVFGPEAEAEALAGRIDAGAVCVNDLIVPTADPRAPFAGRHASGFGATRGAEGLLELTRPKAVFTRKGRFRPHFDPLPEDDHILHVNALAAAHGRGWTSRLRAAMKAVTYLAAQGRKRRV